VVFCESREDAEQARTALAQGLKGRGLTLSEEKTKIVHLGEGFDFLGFHIRRSPAPQTSHTGYRLRITPSKHAVQEVRKKLRTLWCQSLGSEVGTVLNRLNPLIRGWASYFRVVAAGSTFRKLDTWMFHRALRYTKRTHPRKPWYWRKTRYWGRFNRTRQDTWVFGDKRSGAYLLKFAWFWRIHHALVKGTASPDDPALREYWEQRERRKAQLLPPACARSPRPSKDAAWCVARLSLMTKRSISTTASLVVRGEEAATATSLSCTCIVTSRYIAGRLEQQSPRMRDCNCETG